MKSGAIMTLTTEQRRALTLLANADGNGATQQLLGAHGLGLPVVTGLVDEGLVTLAREQVKAGDKTIEVGRVRITDAGRDALRAVDG